MSKTAALLCTMFSLVGCGGDDGGNSGSHLSCSALPACYTDALASLRACVPSPALSLGTPTNSSGVVMNLMCTGSTNVTFSPFSFSATGTVPLPSTITLAQSGTTCATLKTSTGTLTMGGTTRTFQGRTIEVPGLTSVELERYDDGEITVTCGDVAVSAKASDLASCATEVVTPEVVRDDAITMMGVQLLDAAKATTSLFTCTR